MTETELRVKMVQQARSWLGLNEASGSFRVIIDTYNAIRPLPGGYRMSYTDPWCAAFVSAVGQACNLTQIVLPECSCDRMIALYQRHGRWVEDDNYNAQMGDLVMYDWNDSGAGDNTGSADHVGLIVSSTGNEFTVIEGNKSDMVAYRSLSRNGRYIRGFCVPDYASMATESEEKKEEAPQPVVVITEPTEKKTSAITLPWLRKGDKNEVVRAVQILLEGRGYRCGPWSADGEFGEDTHTALTKYQNRKGLEVDGIVGPETWESLLGVK